MKKDKMPSVRALTAAAIAGGGLFAAAGVTVLFNPSATKTALGIMLIGLGMVIAALCRVIGNLVQMFFEFSNFFYKQFLHESEIRKETLHAVQEIKNSSRKTEDVGAALDSSLSVMKEKTERIDHGVNRMKDALWQINCDTKELNQDVHAGRELLDRLKQKLDLEE